MEMHKAFHDEMEKHLAKDHPLMKKHQAMMDHCEKCMKAAKDSMEGEEPEEEPKGDKAATDPEMVKMQAQITELTELVKKMPANATIPHTGATEVAKTVGFEDLLVAK